MSKLEVQVHDVTKVSVQVRTEGYHNYATLTAHTNDGQKYEITLFAERGKAIQVLFGDDDE